MNDNINDTQSMINKAMAQISALNGINFPGNRKNGDHVIPLNQNNVTAENVANNKN